MSSRPFFQGAFDEAFGGVRRGDREVDLFLADLTGQPSPAMRARARRVARDAWPETAETAEAASPKPVPAGAAPRPEIAAQPSLQFVGLTGTPLPGARWAIHQKDAVYAGTLDEHGSTGALTTTGARFDPSLPFYVHVEGWVCSIVSGAQLLTKEPDVQYGGQFLDWSHADDPDARKREAFWKAYAKARQIRGPLYMGPMVKHILGQIDVLKDRLSIGNNRSWILFGKLDAVNWDLEAGGRAMFEFMHRVMQARESSDIKTIPSDVGEYFAKHRKSFDAGTPTIRGEDRNYNEFAEKRVWVFLFRGDIWGMLFGSMPVP